MGGSKTAQTRRLIDELIDLLPVSASGQTNVANSIEGIATPLSALGFVSLIALFWGPALVDRYLSTLL